MKAFAHNGEVIGEERELFREPRSQLSLLGGAAGGGSLSGSATASGPTLSSGGTITVNNAGGGAGFNTTTLLIVSAVGLVGLLLLGLFFRAK